MNNNILIIFIYLALIASCSVSKKSNKKQVTPISTFQDVRPGPEEHVIGLKFYPDLTMEQLNSGYSLYTVKCNTCHSLFAVDKFDKEEWQKIINKESGKAALNFIEIESLTRYLVASSMTFRFKNPK